MANFQVSENPEYTEEIRKFETEDEAHADLFNNVVQKLINNEAFLKKGLGEIPTIIIDSPVDFDTLTKNGIYIINSTGNTNCPRNAICILNVVESQFTEGNVVYTQVQQTVFYYFLL